MMWLPFLADAVVPAVPMSGGMEAALIGLAVLLGSGLIEICKAVLRIIRPSRGDTATAEATKACQLCQTRICSILEIVSKSDGSGAPLIFGGYRLSAEMAAMTTQLRELIRSQDRLIVHFERVSTSSPKE